MTRYDDECECEIRKVLDSICTLISIVIIAFLICVVFPGATFLVFWGIVTFLMLAMILGGRR